MHTLSFQRVALARQKKTEERGLKYYFNLYRRKRPIESFSPRNLHISIDKGDELRSFSFLGPVWPERKGITLFWPDLKTRPALFRRRYRVYMCVEIALLL